MNRSRAERRIDQHSIHASSSQGGNTASNCIKSAEKFASEGKFALAFEQLTRAKGLEPENKYIEAIDQRIRAMQGPELSASAGVMAAAETSELDGNRYLSVTVGKEYTGGIKPFEAPGQQGSDEIQIQVRNLTDQAERLLKQGNCDSAFETLMKAYLLDPMSPEVLACERVVLPAWYLLRSRESAPFAGQIDNAIVPPAPPQEASNILSFQTKPPRREEDEKAREDGELRAMKEGTLNEEALLVKLKLQKEIEREEKEQALLREASAPMMVDTLPAFPTAPASDEKLDEQTRLQRLKEQRENERSEKERALWSEASSPPKLFVDEELVSPEPSPAEGSADESGEEKQTKGFFAKLRRKKSP